MIETEFQYRNKIRARDRYQYRKNHGAIPKGCEIHHKWYSDWYTEASFVIVTHEEHAFIHREDKALYFSRFNGYNDYPDVYPTKDEYIPVDEKDSPTGEYGED